MLRTCFFKSSIRLYGLVKPGQPNSILLVQNPHGGHAIQAFVSRLDAEIAAYTCTQECYQVRLLSQFFDPSSFIADQHGWLAMHICCGFAAHSQHLLETDGRLVPMGWFTYAHVGEWTPEHYLHWGAQLPRQLQALYDSTGQRDYNRLLNELDDACSAEMRWHTDEAIRAIPGHYSAYESPSQFALFDAIECCWRFACSNTDVHEPHTTIRSQGALS